MPALSARQFSDPLVNGDILTRLIEFLEESNIKYAENEPMKNHTTFKVGGNAAVMVFPGSEE